MKKKVKKFELPYYGSKPFDIEQAKIDHQLEINRELVSILSQLVEENPQLRFGQLVEVFEFVHSITEDNQVQYWSDEFYHESYDILERVKNSPVFKNYTELKIKNPSK